MPKQFKNSFDNGGYWEYYKALENQFLDYLTYVPYLDGNEKTHGYRLSNLLKDIGGYVDSSFKEMSKLRKFRGNADCRQINSKVREGKIAIRAGRAPPTVSIRLCLSAFETEYQLSNKELFFKRLPEREKLKPFTYAPGNVPEWWDTYNGIKHDFSSNFKKANLRIVRNALASAFLLNAIHIPSAERLCNFGLIRDMVGNQVTNTPAFKQALENGQAYFSYLETPVFVYYYSPP
jgi:hypothetical protein